MIFFTPRFLKKIKKVFGADLREFFFHTRKKIPKKNEMYPWCGYKQSPFRFM